MIDVNKMLEAVCDHFDVTAGQIWSKSSIKPLPLVRKIIINLMEDHPVKEIEAIVNIYHSNIYRYRAQLARVESQDPELFQLIKSIQEKAQTNMKIKLNNSQIGSLTEVFEDFLTMYPDSVTLELICLHIEEMKESFRKKHRGGKENINLDDKQLRVFLIWYHHYSKYYEARHPHGYMTLLDIINQIKPIAHVQRIPIES